MPVGLSDLPPDLLTETLLISHRLETTDERNLRPTHALARFASLARFLAEPARIASLHTVEACEELAGSLEEDPSVSTHFRTVIFRAPSVDRHGDGEAGGHTQEEKARFWPRMLKRWHEDAVEWLLDNLGSARHLVLNGALAAFEEVDIAALAKRM